jgi:hypothetical protein
MIAEKIRQLLNNQRHSILVAINVESLELPARMLENLQSGVYCIFKEDIEEILSPMDSEDYPKTLISLHHDETASQMLYDILRNRTPVQAFDEVIG